jgi:uncharacterized membrane protein YsdA (DUF1294 family)
MSAALLACIIAGWYGVASVATFVMYAIDKAAARRGRRRVPERVLHAWSLAGGWPGAAVAQSVLRHKSRKQPFRARFWLTVMLNCALLAGIILSWRAWSGLPLS